MKTLKVIGLLALVFIAGFSGGIVAAHIVVRKTVEVTLAHPEKARTKVEQNNEAGLNNKLRLNEQQRERIHQILKDSRDRTRAIREEYQPKLNAVIIETRTNIAAVLNGEQNALFEEFLADNRQFLPYRELQPLPKKGAKDSIEALPYKKEKVKEP